MEAIPGDGKPVAGRRSELPRFLVSLKRRVKLNRFLLVIDLKKGVSISAMCVIVVDLIDLLWHLSMTFGPLNGTFSSLLLLETFLVVSMCLILLYSLKSQAKLDLIATLFTWLVVVAVDYCVRALMVILSLFISEKASSTAKFVREICSAIMLSLVAHCWVCVFSYYDDIKDTTTTVRITPSHTDRVGQRKLRLARLANFNQVQDSALASATRNAPSALTNQMAASNMLRAPEEVTVGNRW